MYICMDRNSALKLSINHSRMKNFNQCLTRWALAVQPYRFKMSHQPGSKNGNADGLSRGPLPVDVRAMDSDCKQPQPLP